MEKSNNFKNSPFLRVSKPFLKKFGLDAAVIVAELVYWHSQMNRKRIVRDNDGYFFYEMFKIEKTTGITPHRQRKAMDILCKAGILEIKNEKKGIPPKRLYKVNVRAYEDEAVQIYLDKEKKQVDNIVLEEKSTADKTGDTPLSELEKYWEKIMGMHIIKDVRGFLCKMDEDINDNTEICEFPEELIIRLEKMHDAKRPPAIS